MLDITEVYIVQQIKIPVLRFIGGLAIKLLKTMSSKFLTELSNDYEKLFEKEIGYDVIIYAGEEPNVKEIHALSNILCIRSQYFNTAFSRTRNIL